MIEFKVTYRERDLTNTIISSILVREINVIYSNGNTIYSYLHVKVSYIIHIKLTVAFA